MNKDKEKKLLEISSNINKALKKKDAVIFLGNNTIEPLPRFSSGSPDVDIALGGGWPKGKVMEVYGPPSCGKTTICYHAIAEFQKEYPEEEVGLVDSEGSWDIAYAKNIGVDVESVLVNQPDDGEDAVNVISSMMDNGVRFILIDSIAALAVRAELENDFGETKEGMGAQARLISTALRRLMPKVSKTETTLMITNQTRNKIGSYYGNPTTTPGGEALKFYASIRAEIFASHGDKDPETNEPMFLRCKLTAKKNKTAIPFKSGAYIISFGNGIDKVASLFETAQKLEIITNKGAWYSIGEQRLGQGAVNSLENFRNSEEFIKYATEKIKEKSKKDVKREAPESKKEETKEDKERQPIVSK